MLNNPDEQRQICNGCSEKGERREVGGDVLCNGTIDMARTLESVQYGVLGSIEKEKKEKRLVCFREKSRPVYESDTEIKGLRTTIQRNKPHSFN